jgi:small subunit ribosomal protein S17
VGKGKILEGTVVSDACDKTITVLVRRKSPHKMYERASMKRKKYHVHDQENKAKAGDKVKIVESRPFSKSKRFRLLEIVK